MRAAREGQRSACQALFARHARMANGLAFRLLGRDAEIDDVVQDAYAIVLGRLDTLDDPQAFASFLASVVVRCVRRLLRRRRLARALGLRPRAEPLDLTPFVAPDAPADVVAELRAVYAFVERLPTDERIALLLRRIERVPLEDAAKLVGCSTATLKRRVLAAERRLEGWSTRTAEPRALDSASAPEAGIAPMIERRAP